MTRRLSWLALWLGASGCGGAGLPAAGDPEPAPRVAVALRFVEADDAGGDPRTEVLLVRIHEESERAATSLGVYAGACTHTDAVEPFLLRASCWWGPDTAALSVARDGDSLVVRRARAGGEVEVVEVIDLPEGAELDVIAPAVPGR